MKRVAIHYLRPPDHRTVYDQLILDQSPAGIVSFQPATRLTRPVEVAGKVVLADGSPVVWFTFPHQWHDIGLFHLPDGTFTGLYANVLTPVEIEGRARADETRTQLTPGQALGASSAPAPDILWRTTDLFLDVFRHPDGRVEILDQDELSEAVAAGAVDAVMAERARQEAATLVRAEAAGQWPPEIVGEWGLERARVVVEGASRRDG